MGFLRGSLCAFYSGNFAEAVRIATSLRVLVHESRTSKPLLVQANPNGLELPILGNIAEWPSENQIASFALGVRMGPTVAPAIDLASAHYKLNTVGMWWNQTVFTFRSRLARQLAYRRKQVVLILANREGGAHVDEHQDPDYVRLLTDLPLSFTLVGHRVETPDLARFLTAQSGVEMLECLKRNFFPEEEIPLKWEFGVPPPVAYYLEQIAITEPLVISAFPTREMRITKRD